MSCRESEMSCESHREGTVILEYGDECYPTLIRVFALSNPS